MNSSALPLPELKERLAGPGLFLRTGAFVTHVRSRIDGVAEGIARLYADFPIVEQCEFADFHVSLDRPANVRRWYKPQVLFRFDGRTPFKPLPLDQAFPMFEWGLNWCVSSHAHRFLILHAAVIEKGGFAAILPAPPGSGKSTLCAGLIQRGWRLLSDELGLLRLDDGKLLPLPRPVSLKNQSIDVIQAYAPDAVLGRTVRDTTKGTVSHLKPPRDSVLRADEPAVPAWVIFPKYRAGAAATMSALEPSRAFLRVAENAFNFNYLGARGFDALGRMVDASSCFEFTYSDLDHAVELFAALRPKEAVL